MATKKTTQNAATKTATATTKTTAFAAKRREAIEHQQAERWEQAAQCWARAGELARSPISKREAEVRIAAARSRMEALAATQMPQVAPTETPAVADSPVAVSTPPAQTSAPAAETPAAAEETQATSTAADKAPRPRDERLPPVGTILRRTDRHGNVRAECTIEQDGFRYAGTLYKTLSAAAIAAAKELGHTSTTQNGFLFWQVAKPTRPERPARSSLGSLERAWERYRERAQQAAQSDARAQAQQVLHGHLNALFAIAGTAAA